jgi:hypothetical protein
VKPRSSRLTNFFVATFATLRVSLTPTQATDEGAEWTLEQAHQCWQPMVRPVQHVGVPGYQFQTCAWRKPHPPTKPLISSDMLIPFTPVHRAFSMKFSGQRPTTGVNGISISSDL